ncbi:protein CHROMATIN REMODELING 24 isoform X4 [Mangifera indica]|uniref:protein CHROMATIN REMODELING 24 isoform X4 n=1 Tax=Mangifera indica TaxID=29780 RepID=UPI001CF9C2EB|nr:protein CHROMATIN REMODELING 24 isoform X4 [Mangifera indica]
MKPKVMFSKSHLKTMLLLLTNQCIVRISLTNFDLSSVAEEEKPVKVKIQGRRRLCKVSYHDVDNVKGSNVVDGEPELSDIVDFNSPPLARNMSKSDNYKSGNEIRDILNDLSSRLEILSIERKNAPKTNDWVDELSGLVEKIDIVEERKFNVPEYMSVDSSLSLTPDLSEFSSYVSRNIVDGGFESVVGDYEEFRGDNETKNLGIVPKKNVLRREDERLVSTRQSFESNFEDEEDGESEVDDHMKRLPEINKHSQILTKNEPKRVFERLRSVGQSFVSYGIEEDDEDDDCVIVSGNNVAKKLETCGGKLEESDHSGVMNVLDECTDGSVLQDDGSITLNGPMSTYLLPGKIAKMLFPHQCEGLRWLWSLHCQGKGGILGDDMGLGKTMQICGFLAGLFHSRLINRVLVVAPKTLLPHWIKELSAVGLSRKTREYFGTCIKTRQYELQYVLQDKGILLTTYDIVRNNSKSLRGDNYLIDESSENEATWDYMILDEGHLIKNPSTQRAKSLLEIPSAHRIIVSGTPIQNNLKELWALFNFCCPELLGDNKWFKEKYENPILKGNDKHASEREKCIGSAVAKELRERIQPYFLRRLKNEVFLKDDATKSATLSKKNEIIVWLRLTNCQRQLYKAFLNSELVLSAFDGSPLAALTILKKICDHPLLLTKRAAEDVLDGMDSMLNPEDARVAEKLAMYIADATGGEEFQEQHDNVSCKISFILALLDDLVPKGHNVLIFSQTRKMLNLIQESIISNGYKFLRIDGTTKASDRVKFVNDFQEGDVAPIFLLTSQVGGLGLTLTKADRVIVVDPAWNPSTDNQSVDRAYRIGQKKDVIVYRLMTCGTVEEKIYRKQIFKGGLFKTATEHKEQIRYFSQQDLRELFSLPEQGFDISLTQQQLHEEHGNQQHNMDKSLEAHIEFLETLGISGVSYHSLLFSKTAPVQVVQEDVEELREKSSAFVGNPSSGYLVERNVDGAEFAFKPKDIKQLSKKNFSSSPESLAKLTESEIKERINRLSQILANKGTVERLPDKGEKLQKQIAELNLKLKKLRTDERSETEVIDVDDIMGNFKRVLNV